MQLGRYRRFREEALEEWVRTLEQESAERRVIVGARPTPELGSGRERGVARRDVS